MTTKLVAIDPGVKSGIAFFDNQNKLVKLQTMGDLEMLDFVAGLNGVAVAIEDSRMIGASWITNKDKRPVALKKARNIGEIDKLCGLVLQICQRTGNPLLCISPKEKGEKLGKDEVGRKKFRAYSGWDEKANEHEIDAAMVGFRALGGLRKGLI